MNPASSAGWCGGSSVGFRTMRVTCPGGARAILTRFGYPKSCSHKPRSKPSSLTGNVGCGRCPMSARWRQRLRRRCSNFGKVWGTTAGSGTSSRPRGRWSRSMVAAFLRGLKICWPCPASGATPPGPSAASRLTSLAESSTAMSSGCYAGSSASTATRNRHGPAQCSGDLLTGWFRRRQGNRSTTAPRRHVSAQGTVPC